MAVFLTFNVMIVIHEMCKFHQNIQSRNKIMVVPNTVIIKIIFIKSCQNAVYTQINNIFSQHTYYKVQRNLVNRTFQFREM